MDMDSRPADNAIDNEFLLQDRIQKVQQIIGKYGEENFYISYSGGKDSNVLSELIDISIPKNKIPRVYADTGIELKSVREFVNDRAKVDDRFIIVKPRVPIKKMLEEVGYPFKSKYHSSIVEKYQRFGPDNATVQGYLFPRNGGRYMRTQCPKALEYQFTEEFKLKVSDKCCDELKKKPLTKFQKENNKPYSITGLMRAERGRRANAQCLVFDNNKLTNFQPLVVMTKEWEDWFIDKYNVRLPSVYYPPYNFTRTGCVCCPFAVKLQEELDTLEKYSPNEKKLAEAIWKPVYDEYRRIGFRLRSDTKREKFRSIHEDETSIVDFYNTHMIRLQGNNYKSGYVYSKYKEYCEAKGIKPQQKHFFVAVGREKGYIAVHATVEGKTYYNVFTNVLYKA